MYFMDEKLIVYDYRVPKLVDNKICFCDYYFNVEECQNNSKLDFSKYEIKQPEWSNILFQSKKYIQAITSLT